MHIRLNLGCAEINPVSSCGRSTASDGCDKRFQNPVKTVVWHVAHGIVGYIVFLFNHVSRDRPRRSISTPTNTRTNRTAFNAYPDAAGCR